MAGVHHVRTDSQSCLAVALKHGTVRERGAKVISNALIEPCLHAPMNVYVHFSMNKDSNQVALSLVLGATRCSNELILACRYKIPNLDSYVKVSENLFFRAFVLDSRPYLSTMCARPELGIKPCRLVAKATRGNPEAL
jgi:hypothetical protein